MKKKPSICFIAHNAYGVLAKVDTAHAGGIEVQTPMMAKWFAARGYDVSMITWDFGFPDGQKIDGVTVYKLCAESDGVPIVRFVWPRWTSFNSALARADADIYYYNCGDLGLGQLVLWAHRNGKKVVQSIANDVDCVTELPALKPIRERVLYRYGLLRADKLVAQTRRQQTALKREFGLDAEVIPMPSAGFEMSRSLESKAEANEVTRVLWVGRFTEEKRLQWLLEIAEKMPNIEFDIIGAANQDSSYAQQLVERAKNLSNVTMHGRLAHDGMGERYTEATMLVCTSVYEGFPNVFLEAWSVGVPLVTTFDPDEVVITHGQGRVADSVEGLIDAIEEMQNREQWLEAANAARSYYLTYHQLDSSMLLFEKAVTG